MKYTPSTFILFSGKKDRENNDTRLKYLAEQMISDGKTVYIFEKNASSILGEAINSEKLKDFSPFDFAAILSFFLTEEEKQRFFKALPKGSFVFGNKLKEEEKLLCEEKNIIYLNLLEDDIFCRENAVPTAEASLSEAIIHSPLTLKGKNILILGYGRVAKETARVFKGIGTNVICAVRRKDVIEEIVSDGYHAAILQKDGISNIKEAFSDDIPIIINTVPPPGIITEKFASSFCPETLFIDLAPSETADMLMSLGIKAVNAPSLPGRFSPQSGAEYIFNAVKSFYSNKKGEKLNE